MSFTMPTYRRPDFTQTLFAQAPNARTAPAPADAVAPEGFHATSIFPEYFKLEGEWRLAEETRMDCAVVVEPDGHLEVKEMRRLLAGERVVLGRSEDASEGIYVNANPFAAAGGEEQDCFSFRQHRSRETAYSIDYDKLYELLRHEREHGNILWVAGPAFSFDNDARNAMQALVEDGFVHGLLSGNALATHDLEAGWLGTALGQDIYTQKGCHNGHYHHLDVLNAVNASGGMRAFVQEHGIDNGIMYSILKKDVPYVLTGSIRDDGPLPEVYRDTYEGQTAMRQLVKKATTVICLATQLHTIATGNMTPVFRVVDGEVRPVFIYTVDISEFVLNKLQDRGSLTAISMVTNAQDFVVHLARGVGAMPGHENRRPMVVTGPLHILSKKNP